MDVNEEIKTYCFKTYQSFFNRESKKLKKEASKKTKAGSALSEEKLKRIETAAQKFAIKNTIIEGMQMFPSQIVQLWHYIYQAHVYKKSGLKNIEVIENVISADQSWKKLSGHAFEEMIKELATLAVEGLGVEFILQRDLNTLIKAGELQNEPRDISWLKEQINGGIFDLYAVVNVDGQKKCFGCVQCKTSIRDRVTRDREPSMHAMQSYFWSIAFTLDGDYFKNPKFQHMVNGGTKEFPENGWHAMYDVSASIDDDRIYSLNIDFELLRAHTAQAAKAWTTQRQWFNNTWRPNLM